MMFIDEVVIYVSSGKGGNGAVHFRREKYISRGGPDGGDGGRGGDVIFEVIPTLNTLSAFQYRQKFIATDGKGGGPKKMTGKSADALVIHVPPGTVIFDQEQEELLGDLVEPGQRLTVCKGGRGGRGNVRFASSSNQAPQIGEKGEPGVERNLRLELKLIADVGIVGVPNAGKSSLLAAVTNATPKIADYPFTTIEPNLGVARLDMDTTLVLADIPGLIEGAHLGIGLGDAFLRHIQRTRVLVHVLDGLSEDPLADFSQINNELALFDPELSDKPQIVVFNKMDIQEVREKWEEVQTFIQAKGYEVLPISTATRENLTPLLWKVIQMLRETPPAPVVEGLPVYRAEADPKEFLIKQDEDGWHVSGKAIERSAAMTYWEHYGSVRRFMHLLEMLGVEDALRKAGITEGESVFIGDYEMEWKD